nr:hypothetical protein [Gordonia humi]
MTDTRLVDVLDRTVGAIDVVLDLLVDSDPLDLKSRRSGSCFAVDAASWTLDTVRWPGTPRWDRSSVDDRSDWWVERIGAVTTLAVAFPGMFGAAARVVPLGAWLGYVDQALVIRAVAREHGAVSRGVGVVMLARILFDRDVSEIVAGVDERVDDVDDDPGLVGRLWEIGSTLYEVSRSLDSRPGPPRLLRWGAALPLVGAPLTYVGERMALRRAVDAATGWIAKHPGVVSAETSSPA